MATRIAFSTVYPDRMKELAGNPTRFPEKLIAGLDINRWIEGGYRWDMREAGYNIQISNITNVKHPKTTTIRKNYDYWKSKEGQLIQPFFWSGKPRKSKQVVFCPEVLLRRVSFIRVLYMEGKNVYLGGKEGDEMPFYIDDQITGDTYGDDDMNQFTQNEGFDHPDHFWMWFDKDYDGALLEFKAVEV